MSASHVRNIKSQPPVSEGLKRTFALTGSVRDLETGEPITGAEVRFSGGRQAFTGAHGLYVFEDVVRPNSNGLDLIWVMAEGYVMDVVEASVSGEDNVVRNFALEPGSEILARVVDPEGEPIEGARIARVLAAWSTHYQTDFETDASGEVLVEDVSRTNPRELLAMKDGYARGTPRTPRFDESGTPEVTFMLERFERELGFYAGHVVSSSGESLFNIEIRANYVDSADRAQEAHEKTESDGRYLLAVQNPKRGFHIVVGGEGYAPQSRLGIRPGPKDSPSVLDFTLKAAIYSTECPPGPTK